MLCCAHQGRCQSAASLALSKMDEHACCLSISRTNTDQTTRNEWQRLCCSPARLQRALMLAKLKDPTRWRAPMHAMRSSRQAFSSGTQPSMQLLAHLPHSKPHEICGRLPRLNIATSGLAEVSSDKGAHQHLRPLCRPKRLLTAHGMPAKALKALKAS